MHTQRDAEQLAKRRRRRSVTVEVEVETYATATVYLSKIPTADLIAELKDRDAADKWNEDGDLEYGFAVFTLDTHELERVRHLFMLGREVEAGERCRRLIADMLGTAI